MNNFEFIRIDPKYMHDKYKYENELTSILFKELFNIKIKYIEPAERFLKLKYLDKRWEKILNLINFVSCKSYDKSIKYFYIDHDVVVNPKILKENKINGTFGVYKLKNKMIASFIDLDLIPYYKNELIKNIFFLKKINNEELLLKKIFFSLKDEKYIFHLPMNSIQNSCFQIHYQINFIQRFIIFNKKIKEKKYLLKLTEKLKKIYKKRF